MSSAESVRNQLSSAREHFIDGISHTQSGEDSMESAIKPFEIVIDKKAEAVAASLRAAEDLKSAALSLRTLIDALNNGQAAAHHCNEFSLSARKSFEEANAAADKGTHEVHNVYGNNEVPFDVHSKTEDLSATARSIFWRSFRATNHFVAASSTAGELSDRLTHLLLDLKSLTSILPSIGQQDHEKAGDSAMLGSETYESVHPLQAATRAGETITAFTGAIENVDQKLWEL